MQALKFRVGHSIRRDSLPIDGLTFNVLLSTFQDLFGRPLHETLVYRDDELEWIDVSSDRELREAIRLNRNKTLEFMTVTIRRPQQNHPIHPRINNTNGACNDRKRHTWRRFAWENNDNRNEERQQDDSAKHSEQSSFDRYHGRFRHPASCDNCKCQIVGVRHKCNDCLDFDLCEDCIDKSDTIHPGHTFNALARSFRRWHHQQPDRAEAPKQDVTEQTQKHVTLEAVPSTTPKPSRQEHPQETKEEQKEPQLIYNQTQNQPQAHEQVHISDNVKKHAEEKSPEAAINKSNMVEALHTLQALGYNDRAQNVRLFISCGGDLQKIVDQLLGE